LVRILARNSLTILQIAIMENQAKYQHIIDKLSRNIKFGLFEDGKCFFSDGEQVSYTALWKALRIIHQLPDNHHKTIPQLCSNTFAGTFTYKYSRHNWQDGTPRSSMKQFRDFIGKIYWELFLANKLSYKQAVQVAHN